MKTILAALVGAACGAGATIAVFKANPPGSDALATAERSLEETRFDLDASKKAETRLREQLAELKKAQETTNAELAAVLESKRTPATGATGPDKAADAGGGNFSNIMERFGKAQSDLAFRTLVESLGLEGEALEEFSALFEDVGKRKQAAMGKFLTGGLTLEELALIEGYAPAIDEWVASNLDGDAQAAYAEYQEAQELNRIERKANEELTWLTAMINLSPEQKDAAYDIFAQHQSRERPQDFLQHTTMDQLDSAWDQSMGSRFAAMEGVLTAEQMAVYQEQSRLMGEMFKGFIRGSLEGGDASP